MKKQKHKPRKGPTPLEVLMFDGRLSEFQARAALRALDHRKFVILTAREWATFNKGILQKMEALVQLATLQIAEPPTNRKRKLK